MDWILIAKAVVLGVVEGITEFLPVSSTGHLILAGNLLDFNGSGAKTFLVVIQFGAILAVCWEYRRRIAGVVAGLLTDASARRFAINVVIATIPAVLLGMLFEAQIKRALFAPVPVAFALVMGGIVILWAQARERSRGETGASIGSLDELRPLDAFKVGCAQCCALIPGVSRSGSTIIGAMLLGVERRVATEFSFFLAIPIIVGATLYELVKHGHGALVGTGSVLTVGTVAAFVSAFVCVRWLLRYLATHDFTVFAWYRIAFGMLVLVIGYSGELDWRA
ncbi:undecaprenyl-diphosphate phosphatase [Paraburkholderia sp. NMBU_R16]|uniref:undecaprenyl-diphosphate phosphatase n=1 Tax=Paraburkholderia sp. NMBU_R16 TaxID=2698676 RepID=UPI0015643775|nr:undecaprenyl-diphosphate phosphatase [Paraburkholderia sp. NMBU_R16]NRO98182.1 undecaprenyl-diphosphate phosphatase [Paraburkholderia sp. NMBU_R16]